MKRIQEQGAVQGFIPPREVLVGDGGQGRVVELDVPRHVPPAQGAPEVRPDGIVPLHVVDVLQVHAGDGVQDLPVGVVQGQGLLLPLLDGQVARLVEEALRPGPVFLCLLIVLSGMCRIVVLLLIYQLQFYILFSNCF